MFSILKRVTFVLVLCSAAAVSQAGLIYKVSNTSVTNCSGSPHGLWTSRSIGGSRCSNYFSISDGTLSIVNKNGKKFARLTASATNPDGLVANIDLGFGKFRRESTYKREGGGPLVDAIDFFRKVKGVIAIGGKEFKINSFVSNYAFQFGPGANAKSASEYGASAWIRGPHLGSPHWDLNLTLTKVPEPGVLALLFVGLLGGLAARKRAR